MVVASPARKVGRSGGPDQSLRLLQALEPPGILAEGQGDDAHRYPPAPGVSEEVRFSVQR